MATDNIGPVAAERVARVMKAREAPDKFARVTRSMFVSGGPDAPLVTTRVVPVERVVDGVRRHDYEIRVDIDGARLGARSAPPPMKARVVTDRIADVTAHERLLSAFVPEHLSVQPRPLLKAKPRFRMPARLRPGVKYETTVFDPDGRSEFRDTSYPWSAFGRCETNLGPFSGVMVGPRHLLTCNHGIDWTPPPGFDADWLTFTPGYFDGDAPFGSTYATLTYVVKKNNNNGVSDGDEGQFDYAVCVLNDRIGESTGWLGARRYTDGWDGSAVWWHIGYPGDLSSFERPTWQSGIALDGHDSQDDTHQEILHKGDVKPGQSGGAVFGFWDGDVGPRAVAVQSWQNDDTNGASGGGDLVDLIIRARNENP